jgi:putative acetyltransferase
VTGATPDGVTLRAERAGDSDAVRDVVVTSFGEVVVGALVDGLRASDAWIDGLSFVAEADGQLVGHVLFTRSRLDALERLVDVLVLSPLGVLPDYQHRGIGSALVRYGLEQVRQRPEPLVFLEGSPTLYLRFGFEPGGDLGFRKPSLRIPDAAFQVVKQPTYDSSWMTGTLVYADAFWRHDCVGLRGERLHKALAGS